jgi:hypothetical protein
MTERDPNETGPATEPATEPPTIEPEPVVPAAAADLPRASDLHLEGTNGEPAPTTQVAATAAPSRGGARRWGIALVIVALVIGIGAAAAFLLAGSSAPSAILAYAPKDAVTYMSARLDLPGDQRAKVGELLSKFPGFADQSTLEQKLGEVLDRLVGDATNDEQSYTGDLKPWFGGEVGVAIGELPDPSAATTADLESGSMLALVSVSDAAAARAWFDGVVADQPTSTETYGGLELVRVGDAPGGVMAIVGGKVMLLGDEGSVKAAIDGGGQGGLSTNEQFRAAQAATTGDHLATFYVDTGAYADWLDRAAVEMPGTVPGIGFAGMDELPPWTAGRLRAEGDALVWDVVAPQVEGAPERTNRVSNVAARVPASTIAVIDIHDAGTGLQELIDAAKSDPATADALRDVESAVAFFGGFEGLIGWIGDAGIVVTGQGADIGGGLVVSATDAESAERFSTTVSGILVLAGGEMGIDTREVDYNGTSITFLDVTGIAEPQGLEGDIPEIGWAVKGDTFVLGVGEAFIESVLDTTQATSLAESERYRELIGRAGREHIVSAWVDLVALRATIEAFGATEPGGLRDYEQDVKPYLEPFDALVATSAVGGDLNRSTIIISVK